MFESIWLSVSILTQYVCSIDSVTDVDIEQWVLEAKECTSHHSCKIEVLCIIKCYISWHFTLFFIYVAPQDLPATWQEDYVCLIDAANVIR